MDVLEMIYMDLWEMVHGSLGDIWIFRETVYGSVGDDIWIFVWMMHCSLEGNVWMCERLCVDLWEMLYCCCFLRWGMDLWNVALYIHVSLIN